MWYQSKENTSPYTQMTGYSQLCFSEFEPDCNVVVVDDGTLTPLYTHPAELTDEEIKQIWYDLYPLSSSSYWDDKREGLAELKFAKAILRKAQEK